MIFEDIKSIFARQIVAERLIMSFFGIGGVLGLTTPVLFPSQNREAKLLEHLYGVGSFAALTFAAKLKDSNHRIYSSIKNAQLQSLKMQMQHELAFHNSVQQVESIRRIAHYVLTLPDQEQARWIAQFNLHGIIEEIERSRPQQQKQVFEIPQPDVVTLRDEDVQEITDPAASSVLEVLQDEHPSLIRIDGGWINELCGSSSEQDMTKRSNHHFYLSGGTQSGKSTLAGVIINKIAARSQIPAMITGSDPKDGVTNWLCQFSKIFPGMESCPSWIRFATAKIEERKEAITRGESVGEMFLLQDEVDTVYGGGKGFPGKISPEIAQNLQALWNYIAKYSAALKVHGVFLGQSPLSGDTGFSRPNLKNLCFIALGGTASYILDNPKDFISVSKQEIEVLRTVCRCCEEAKFRYALVIPTRGKAFVGVVPVFDIPKSGTGGKEQREDSTSLDWYSAMQQWYQSLDVSPSIEEVKTKWHQLTGKNLDDKGVQLLLETINTSKGMET